MSSDSDVDDIEIDLFIFAMCDTLTPVARILHLLLINLFETGVMKKRRISLEEQCHICGDVMVLRNLKRHMDKHELVHLSESSVADDNFHEAIVSRDPFEFGLSDHDSQVEAAPDTERVVAIIGHIVKRDDSMDLHVRWDSGDTSWLPQSLLLSDFEMSLYRQYSEQHALGREQQQRERLLIDDTIFAEDREFFERFGDDAEPVTAYPCNTTLVHLLTCE